MRQLNQDELDAVGGGGDIVPSIIPLMYSWLAAALSEAVGS